MGRGGVVEHKTLNVKHLQLHICSFLMKTTSIFNRKLNEDELAKINEDQMTKINEDEVGVSIIFVGNIFISRNY